MPHRNLYGVTASLRQLVHLNLFRIAGVDVEVTDLPPEEAEKETGLGLNPISTTRSRRPICATSSRRTMQVRTRSRGRRCR